MRDNRIKKGFTLVELLVAMALIVTIMSMVYGSYFATAKSASTCSSRMAASTQAQTALRQIARLVRTCWAPACPDSTAANDSAPAATKKPKLLSEQTPNYFKGGTDGPADEFLHLVTTTATFAEPDGRQGLFDVTYKFDRTTGVIYADQAGFVGACENTTPKKNWRPIAENIRSVELVFFDGRDWLESFSFRKHKKLPCAVRIIIASEDENHKLYTCKTGAAVSCRQNQNEKTQFVNSVSVVP